MWAREDLVEDRVAGGFLFGEGAGDDGFGLLAEDAQDGDEFCHFGADEEALQEPGRGIVRHEDEEVHEPGELVEQEDVVEAVLDGVVEFGVEVGGFDFRLGDVEEVSGGDIWAEKDFSRITTMGRGGQGGCSTCSIRREPMLEIDDFALLSTGCDATKQSIDSLLNDWLQARDSLL